MDLWIRSQDKKCLLKATMFNLDNDENGIYCYSNEDNFCLLGKYATKKRALEVLDSIQSCIQTNTAFDLYAKLGSFADDFNNKYNLVPVYQMPEE